MKRLSVFLLGILLTAIAVPALTIHIPQDRPTIQAGINAAVNGDTVLVSPGTYNEAINYLGKDIVVKSASGPQTTMIIYGGSVPRVTFNSGESRAAVLEGFTITGGGSSPGILCAGHAAPVIRGNLIENNINYGGQLWGGGIEAGGSSPLIENNQILQNTGMYYGGGINMGWCGGIEIRGNIIAGNNVLSGEGTATGGGIYATGGRAVIERNLFIHNIADPSWPGFGYGAGIFIEAAGNFQISHNTMSGNWASPPDESTSPGGCVCTGYYYPRNTAISLSDNIIVNSRSCCGLVIASGNPVLTLSYNDVWNNPPSNYWHCIPGPNDISADPSFTGGAPFSFQLTADSPCIDAGSFTSLPDPDGTRSDVGAYYYDQPGMNVALKTATWPIIIPAQGGSFSSQLYLTNHTTSPQTCDVWIEVIHLRPDSIAFFMLRQNLTFNAGLQVIRNLTQSVPATAPPGNYLYRAHTGHYGPGHILCEVDMPFTKQGFGTRDSGFGEWSLSGWEDYDLAQDFKNNIHPSFFIFHPCSPNPFNASTAISYQLSAVSHVKLTVYDTAGRLVTTLVDGWREGGTHEVTFDGSKLASGIYLARLDAGTFTAVQKLVLMK